MARKSYGTITIADITDGYNTATIYLYQRTSNTSPVKPGNTRYTFSSGILEGSLGLWTRDIPSGTDPLYATTVTVRSMEPSLDILGGDWSTPVILTQNGQDGNSVTAVRELYYLDTHSSTSISAPTRTADVDNIDKQNGWTSVLPTYVSGGIYWTCIESTIGNSINKWSTAIKNDVLTNSYVDTAEINYLRIKIKKIWSNNTGSYIAAGINGADVTEGTENTYGYNVVTIPTGINFRFNGLNIISLGMLDNNTPALRFYQPPNTSSNSTSLTQGNRLMELSGNSLRFFDGTSANNLIAKYGTEINLYKPGTMNPLVTIDQTGGYFSGTLSANAGTIGGLTITQKGLVMGAGTNIAGTGGDVHAFWAGAENSNDAPFSVTYDGTFKAVKGEIGSGVTINNVDYLYNYTVDTSNLNQNTWYPVIISTNSEAGFIYFSCVFYDGGGTPSWSTHSTSHWSASVKASYYPSVYGWMDSTQSYLDAYSFKWLSNASQYPIILSDELNHSDNLVVYFRGGATYPVKTNSKVVSEPKTSTYVVGDQSVAPFTTIPSGLINGYNDQVFTSSRKMSDVNRYITTISNGIEVKTANTSNNYIRITGDYFAAYKNGIEYFYVDGSALRYGAVTAASTAYADNAADEAETAAAADATTKANSALTSAKSYVDNRMIVLSDGLYMYSSTTTPPTAPTTTNRQNSARVSSSGLDIYKNNVNIASFGANTRIGLADKGRIEITPDYFQVITKRQNTAINVSTEDSPRTVTLYISIATNLSTTQINSISVPELNEVASGTSFLLRFELYFTEGAYGWAVQPFSKGTNKTIASQTSYCNYSVEYVANENTFKITISNLNSQVKVVTCNRLIYQKTTYIPQIYMGGDIETEGKTTIADSLKVGNNLDVSGYCDIRGDLTSYGTIKGLKNIYTQNNISLGSLNTYGDYRALAFINNSDNTFFGQGSYANNEGNVYYRGNAVHIQTKGAIHAAGNILPSSDNTYNLGNTNYHWNQLWIGGNIVRDTAPAAQAQTYAAIWHKTDNNNYTLVRPTGSSIRYKEDIKDIVNEELNPHNLYNIRVKQFKFKRSYLQDDDPYNRNRYDVIGLIAEDVEKNYPIATIKIDGEPENWNERYIIPPMLALIQEQHKEIEQLKEEVAELKNKVNI